MDTIIEKNSLKREEQEKKIKTKRYNLMLPIGLYDQLHVLAEEQNTVVLELLKRFIKMGLAITELSQSSDARFIIREGDKERELIFL